MGKDDPELIHSSWKESATAACRPERRWSAAKRPSCPTSTKATISTWPASASASSNASRILDGKSIRPGDAVIGLASSGFHSNGYSLIRRIVFGIAGLTIDQHVPDLDRTVGDVLLEPTRIYSSLAAGLLKQFPARTGISGFAHITGGGLKDNIERLLPDGCQVRLDRRSWKIPPEFMWLQELGDVDREEMFRVFNMGIGFVAIVRAQHADGVRRQLHESGAAAWLIGEVRGGERGVEFLE